MKIQTISNEVINIIKEELTKLFNSEVESIDIDCLCPSKAIDILESLGADVSEELNTNGWQYDYWIKFTHKSKRYYISGSGYYGNVMIAEEE